MCHYKTLQWHLLVARRTVAAFICQASTFVQLIVSLPFIFYAVKNVASFCFPCCTSSSLGISALVVSLLTRFFGGHDCKMAVWLWCMQSKSSRQRLKINGMS